MYYTLGPRHDHSVQLSTSPTRIPHANPASTWVLECPSTSLSLVPLSSSSQSVCSTTLFRIWACFPACSLTFAASYITMALKPKQIWEIRFYLNQRCRLRDRALFDLAIDSKRISVRVTRKFVICWVVPWRFSFRDITCI